MTLTEQAAYLKGLAEGMGLNEADVKDRMILKLLDLTVEMAESIEALETRCNDLADYADELDSDLGDVEEYLFVDEDEEYDDEDDEDYDEDEDGLYEAVCPSCGEVICFDDSCDPSDLICPACGEAFDLVECDSCDGACESCDGDCGACGEE